MKTRLVLSVISLILTSVVAQGQCQDQSCTFSPTCYTCGAGSGQGCQVSSCDSCTNSRCPPPGGGGGHGGELCQKLPQTLPIIKLASQNDRTKQHSTSTSIAMLSDEGAPAELVSFNVRTDAVLRHVVLFNTGKKTIIGYQLGWISASASQSARVALGPKLQMKNWEAGRRIEIAEHPFSSPFLEKTEGINSVGFFVASVVFSDGSSWMADLARLTGNTSPSGKNNKDLKRGAA